MFRQFKFEEQIYDRLEEIPISALFKLDLLGFTFPLETWNALALEERWVICHMPIRSRGERECYCNYLKFLLRREGAPFDQVNFPPGKKGWEDISRVPPEVVEKSREFNLPLFWPDWIKMDDMERYIIHKLCREKSDGPQIQQVIQELLGFSNTSSSLNR